MANTFICHRGADAAPAERLASDLRNLGHDVWLDEWKINIGDSIIQRIDEGLIRTSFLIMCYSDIGLSPWMDREWMSTLARQLNGAAIRILPACLTGGIPPAILADIKYADLGKEWSSGVKALHAAMV